MFVGGVGVTVGMIVFRYTFFHEGKNGQLVKNKILHCARGQGPAGIFRPVFEVGD